MRILLIEDEQELLSLMAARLRSLGYAVDTAAEGREGHYMGCEYPIDIAVVDLGLPDWDGIEIIQRWRNATLSFPILILTARSRWQEKVEGLEAGADDYLVKPFHVEELLARIRALIRRSGRWSRSNLSCGPITVDPARQEVRVDERTVVLTSYEYRLLEYLMLRAGEVVSKTDLSEHCYEDGTDRDSNVLEVLVGRLRRKLDPEGTLKPIETLRGRGYRLAGEREVA